MRNDHNKAIAIALNSENTIPNSGTIERSRPDEWK